MFNICRLRHVPDVKRFLSEGQEIRRWCSRSRFAHRVALVVMETRIASARDATVANGVSEFSCDGRPFQMRTKTKRTVLKGVFTFSGLLTRTAYSLQLCHGVYVTRNVT